MKLKFFTLTFFTLVSLSGLFGLDISLVSASLENAINEDPARMIFTEEGGADSKRIEYLIEGGRYRIGESTDNNLKPNKYDDRPQYKTGDSDAFNLIDYAGYLYLAENGTMKESTRSVQENGKEYNVVDVNVSVYDFYDKQTYPVSGILLVDSKSSVPYKMKLSYDVLPENTKKQDVSVYFVGYSPENCRLTRVSIAKKGKFLLFSYTLNSEYLFEY